jgi:hypothetical protein
LHGENSCALEQSFGENEKADSSVQLFICCDALADVATASHRQLLQQRTPNGMPLPPPGGSGICCGEEEEVASCAIV